MSNPRSLFYTKKMYIPCKTYTAAWAYLDIINLSTSGDPVAQNTEDLKE